MGAQGVSALPLLVVEHPLGGERPEAIARRAQQAFEQLNAIVAGSARPAQAVGGLSETARAPHAESTDPMTVADDPMAVLEAFTQRWEFNGKHAETIEEVGPELPFFDHFSEIPMCGADHAHIGANRRSAA